MRGRRLVPATRCRFQNAGFLEEGRESFLFFFTLWFIAMAKRSRLGFFIIVGVIVLAFLGTVGGIFLVDYLAYAEDAKRTTGPPGPVEKPGAMPGAR